MRETIGPPLRVAALLAFITGLVLLLLHPPSFGGLGGLLALLAGAAAIVLVTAWATVALISKEAPEPEFGGWSTVARPSPCYRRPTSRPARSTSS